MANIILTLSSGEAYTRLASLLNLKTSDSHQNLPKIANVLAGMGAGAIDFTSGKLEVTTTAKALVTFTAAAANNETMTINGVTFTAKTSGAVAANGEFNLSTTVATQAANLIAAINAVADAKISGRVTAAANTAYIATITSTGTATAGDTFTLNGVVFTATASAGVPANAEWDISATPATQAANIAAAINAVADVAVAGIVTASSTAGVVTITSVADSSTGLSLTENAANVTRTTFAAGTSGVVTVSAVYPGAASLGYSITESMAGTAVTAWALDANATNTTL